jgi:hypothetical protein
MAMPAIAMAATSRIFERLKMIPPIMGFIMLDVLAWLMLSTKLIPLSPMLPKVNPKSSENRSIPKT